MRARSRSGLWADRIAGRCSVEEEVQFQVEQTLLRMGCSGLRGFDTESFLPPPLAGTMGMASLPVCRHPRPASRALCCCSWARDMFPVVVVVVQKPLVSTLSWSSGEPSDNGHLHQPVLGGAPGDGGG